MDLLSLILYYLVDQEDGLKQLLTFFLNSVMQEEAHQQAGAYPYERGSKRKAHRNGIRTRTLKTRVGDLILDKPQLREIPFETKVFERYSRVENALLMAVAESYIQGVSTRRIQSIVKKFGLENISASTVSRICTMLDEQIQEFLSRPIEMKIRYLFVDASYFKVRNGARYLNRALLVVTGVREDGYREILAIKIADSEGDGFWSDLFGELKERGLEGVELVISDGHKGIQEAVKTSFIGASWQMCTVHFMRAVLKSIHKKADRKEVARRLKEAIEDEVKMQKLADDLRDEGKSKAADTIERYRFDLWNYKAFPKAHWKRIRTTNVVERINKELKRRTRVAGAYPNDRSLMRVAGSIVMDINEEWITGRRYLSMDEE